MTTHMNTHTAHLTYARIAGFTLLFYIAIGITSMALPDQSSAIDLLSVLMSISAVVLGVTLYELTRSQGPVLAMLGMTFRIVEAVSVSTEAAIFFAAGSTLFSWLLLRGRLIPVALAWLGVIASILLVVVLPLQLAGLFGGVMSWSGPVTWLIWLPMLVFEVVLAFWLLIRGVALPTPAVGLTHTA